MQCKNEFFKSASDPKDLLDDFVANSLFAVCEQTLHLVVASVCLHVQNFMDSKKFVT